MTYSSSQEILIREILQTVPSLTPVYEEHLQNNDELIPYVMMDDFFRYFLEQGEWGESTKTWEEMAHFIGILEKELGGRDEEMKTMIRTTFVESLESLWNEADLFRKIYSLLGPNLQTEIRWKP